MHQDTSKGESVYFNKLWTWRKDSYTPSSGNYCKNIFLDKTRIVTKIRAADETSSADAHREYFYHGDHLQSATLITDYEGSVYERINYTPYGELWLEKSDNNGENYLPYRFTGKELDSETGLYYYGARYLNPKYSHWISTDPALGEYIPQAPVSDEAKKHNQNLPGMGGVFNHINGNLYHYAGNNPVKYTDPDGKFDIEEFCKTVTQLFSSRDEKYSQFNDYKIDKVIDEKEFNYYQKNPESLKEGQETFYRQSKNGYEYCLATITEFGKMSKGEKINAIISEYNKSVAEYESNKSTLKDSLVNLGYGTAESLSNIAQNGSIEEFLGNYLLNNMGNIGDLSKSEVDAINILRDLSFLRKKLDYVQNHY